MAGTFHVSHVSHVSHGSHGSHVSHVSHFARLCLLESVLFALAQVLSFQISPKPSTSLKCRTKTCKEATKYNKTITTESTYARMGRWKQHVGHVLRKTCLWRTVSDWISGAENCTVTRRSPAHWPVMSEGNRHVFNHLLYQILA